MHIILNSNDNKFPTVIIFDKLPNPYGMCYEKKCVRNCCCCLSLKVGGNVIALMSLLQNVIFIYRGNVMLYMGVTATVYSLVVTPFFLWGIYAKARRFMIPFLVGVCFWLVIALWVLVLFAAYPVGTFVVDEEKFEKFATEHEKILFCAMAFVEMVAWMYYYIVVQSLYIEVKQQKLAQLAGGA